MRPLKKMIATATSPWLYRYLSDRVSSGRRAARGAGGRVHVLVCIVDHFEPYHGGADHQEATARVESWQRNYPLMAARHADADGKRPQHTWFYPPHNDLRQLPALVELARNGYGEIEMHLHHNHMPPFPDTSQTLKSKIRQCIEDYAVHGIFCQPDGSRTFGFVHGDWSLANACGEGICGVNDEIAILRECGCYADFTFPSLGKAQPRMVNRHYYVKGDPARPKSHDSGQEVRTGGAAWGDLLLITGILGIRWKAFLPVPRPSLESSDLDGSRPPSAERIDYWVKNAVTVQGREDWLFIKLHVHGAVESAWDGQLFEGADRMFGYFEERYNDGESFKLHYLSAREMYNLVKAAEAGMAGDPNDYRDFVVAKYPYR